MVEVMVGTPPTVPFTTASRFTAVRFVISAPEGTEIMIFVFGLAFAGSAVFVRVLEGRVCVCVCVCVCARAPGSNTRVRKT